MERETLNGQQAEKDPDEGSWDPGEGGPYSLDLDLGLRVLPWNFVFSVFFAHVDLN